MSTPAAKTAQSKPAGKAAAGRTVHHLQAPAAGSAAQAEYDDLVDRIFSRLPHLWPALVADPNALDEAKRAIRDEFGGTEAYIRSNRTQASKDTAQRVLAKFNGRNAREIARELGIGRTTVYRMLKQAGGTKR